MREYLVLTIILPICLYWEQYIVKRNDILDVGHWAMTWSYVQLDPMYIRCVNMFFGAAASAVIPVLMMYGTKRHVNIYAIGTILRCITGTMTQLPYALENTGFNEGELGGFGADQSMIWFFSGHAFSISCCTLVLQNRVPDLYVYMWVCIQVLLILWYLSIRAHYSIDLFVGTVLPFVLNAWWCVSPVAAAGTRPPI